MDLDIKSGIVAQLLASMKPDTPPKNIVSGDPQTAFADIVDNAVLTSGVWSCTVGSWNIPSYSVNEVMLLLAGRLRLTNSNGTVTELSEGQLFYLPKGWSGQWEVLEDMQKIYVIVY